MYNQAGITLYGMFNYFNNIKDEDLFENIELFPGGEIWDQTIPAIDKEILIDTILEESGEFLTYRQIPERFKIMVNRFFAKHYNDFTKIWIAYNMDYNPIFNYDRYEDWLDKSTYNSSMQKRGYDKNSMNGSESRINDKSNYKELEKLPFNDVTQETSKTTDASRKTTFEISADDSESFLNERRETREEGATPGKITSELKKTNQGERSFTGTEIDSVTYGLKGGQTSDPRYDQMDYNSDDKHTGNDQQKHDGHLWGNIGVTTSAQMVAEIKDVYKDNPYNYFSDVFAKEMLIRLY